MKKFCIFCFKESLYYFSLIAILIYGYVVYYNYDKEKSIKKGYTENYYKTYSTLSHCPYNSIKIQENIYSFTNSIRYDAEGKVLCKY